MSDTTFGKLLRGHRVTASLSQEDLAARARLSAETIGALERGVRRAPYRETVAMLADALSLSGDDRRELERAAERNRLRAGASPRPDPPNNLPFVGTSLIGRESETAEIATLLGEYRLVTITGSGGVGKTRAAVEVATRLMRERNVPVTFVDLSPVSDPRFILSNVATLIELSPDGATVERVATALESKAGIFVVDNCEHVLEPVSELVAAIVRSCPKVTILATSRERLGIPGERAYRLPSLAFPASGTDPSSLENYASIDLFLERAAAAAPSVVQSATAKELAADICRRLAGVPLAIELAAARAGSLGLAEMSARLNDRFILARESEDVPARQRTMSAAIDWSYQLLADEEKAVFCRLAIFPGSFRLDAAEAVCAGETIPSERVVDVLIKLVAKSLVNVVRDGERVRYILLETVRSFAFERLGERDDPRSIVRRHLRWAQALAERCRGFPGNDWRPEVSAELENLRALLGWAFASESDDDAATGADILGRFYAVWIVPGFAAEFRRWSGLALERIDEAQQPEIVEHLMPGLVLTARGSALPAIVERAIRHFERSGKPDSIAWGYMVKGMDLHRRGYFTEALAASEKAVATSRTAERDGRSRYPFYLSRHALMQAMAGRLTEGRANIDSCIASARASGDETDLPGFIRALAVIEFLDGNVQLAATVADDLIRGQREQGYSFPLELSLLNAGCFHLALGELDEAEQMILEAFDGIAEPGDQMWNDAIQLLAAIAAHRNRAVAAARMMGFADSRFAADGSIRNPLEQFVHDHLQVRLREQLSPEELSRHAAAGGLLSEDAGAREARKLARDVRLAASTRPVS